MFLLLYHRSKKLICFFTVNSTFYFSLITLISFVFIFSACIGISSKLSLFTGELAKPFPVITIGHPVFDELGKKWISSSYFDRSMQYKNSRLEVVSFSDLLDKYETAQVFDAILLNCFDDYQGIILVDDIRRYDLQLATNIALAHGSDSPSWLQPLLLVVPDSKNPPFLERFLTANINELQFVRLADYYAPLDKENMPETNAGLGRVVFKNNCLFCHSINSVGGNKGGSLLEKFNFQLDKEKRRFKKKFLLTHGQFNASKQNTNQFLAEKDLDNLSMFLSALINR